jgi:RNA polymerase sigma factor (TIGR02999 family)
MDTTEACAKPSKILTPMPRESAQPSHRITQLLRAWSQGDAAALAELTPLVHSELRLLARGYMKDERRDHTLQATALVNECFVRLMDARQVEWKDRSHFFALSARLMRRILVDVARARRYDKRGGGAEHVPLDESVPAVEPGRDLIALDDALQSLATIDERKSHVVELRFFGGLSHEETADILGVSAKTVMREWQVAKMWLFRELRHRKSPEGSGIGG